MNKSIVVLYILLILSSCDSSLDVYLPSDPFPVIYGAICPKDSVHRIVIRKSISCGDSIEWYAKNPDSIQYDEISAFLEMRSPEGLVIKRTPLVKSLEDPRAYGFFSNEPNWIYECPANDLLDPVNTIPGLTYTLTVYSPRWKKSAYAQTVVPPSMDVLRPNNVQPFELDMSTQNAIDFVWERSTLYYVEFNMKVIYYEYINGEYFTRQFVTKRQWKPWPLSFTGDKIEQVVINGDWFYTLMANRIKDDPSVEFRKFGQIDFAILTGDPAFYDYFASINYTTDYDEKVRGNILNGNGIFIAYNSRNYNGYRLNSESLDSLSTGQATRRLKFIKW